MSWYERLTIVALMAFWFLLILAAAVAVSTARHNRSLTGNPTHRSVRSPSTSLGTVRSAGAPVLRPAGAPKNAGGET